jgi:hypothetical protein
MDFEALRVDQFPVDAELQDAGTVGPELAHLAGVYRRSPRALIWRNPSSDWRLFVLLPPLASRLSLMVNPIFAQLTRAWGLNVRFVGVDRDGLAYDFRSLLSDVTLKLLVELLSADSAEDPKLLDALFAALAREMLTILQRRARGWGRHLDVEHRLEPQVPASLFSRETRYPDFLAKLRAALRDEIVDVAFYGRALRSIDLREASAEERIASMIEAALDPVTLAKLARTGVGRHLGCYNWLRLDARHAAPRAHVLTQLPGLATFFAEALVPPQAALLEAVVSDPDAPDADAGEVLVDPRGRDPHAGRHERRGARGSHTQQTLDLRAIAARSASSHSERWAAILQRAVDAGQDRAVIEALAQRFSVADNLIRRLWREAPAALGQPPTWHLAQILRQLADEGERAWPVDDAQWHALIARAVPAEAG